MTMTTFSVYREPRRVRFEPFAPFTQRPKRVGEVTILDEGVKFAVGQWIHDTYLRTGNRQFAGYRMEWRSNRSLSSEWQQDDGEVKRGREWSVVVTFRNGAAEHETRFLFWEDERTEARW